MRVRTEDKRREIIEVAGGLFQEQGFDRTSMAQISQQLGGSKATLYGYFRSKEELLLACLDYDVTEQAEQLMGAFLSAKSVHEALVILGVAYMERRLAPRPISNVRMVASQPEESGIGRIFYDTVLFPAWQRLCQRLEMLMDEGRLRRADPWVAAMQWKGLVEADMFDRRLMGAIREPDPEEIRRWAVLAADAFVAIYGPEPAKQPRKTRKRAA